MKRFLIGLVAVALAMVGVVSFWPSERQLPAATDNRQMERPSVASSQAVAARAPILVPSAPATARILSNEEFDEIFAVEGADRIKLRNAVFAIAGNLQEMKGLYARVVRFDGTTLEMEIPALRLPDQALEAIVMDSLEAALGNAKAKEIWNDPDGKLSLLDRAGYNLVIHGTRYQFTMIKPENDPAKSGSMGYASFDAKWGFTGEDAPHLPDQVFRGFTLANANNIGMSWNAMSKAPQGYFRSEPIKTQSSSGSLAPIIIEDQKTGETEILNVRHKGSSDKVPRG